MTTRHGSTPTRHVHGMLVAGVLLGAGALPLRAQQANYEVRGRSFTLRVHGDTVWNLTDSVTTRVVRRADSIWVTRQVQGRSPVVTGWAVQGETAYATRDGRTAHVPTRILLGYFDLAERMRRVEDRLRRLREP